MALYQKHRPTKFSEIVGQPEAVNMLTAMGKSGKIPGFILLTGPSGVGKTTIARILKTKLGVEDSYFEEINAAKDRGIDLVRSIEERGNFRPMCGNCRMWLVDECSQLTPAAQGSFLKILEDINEWTQFIFCTTEPEKLRSEIRTRATVIDLKPVSEDLLIGLVQDIAKREGSEVDDDLARKIAELAEGSPRKALVVLEQVIGLDTGDRLEALTRSIPKREAYELCHVLIKGSGWSDAASIIKCIGDDQIESVRWMVLGYMSKVALNNRKQAERACHIINCFREDFFRSGKAGLILACWDAIHDS